MNAEALFKRLTRLNLRSFFNSAFDSFNNTEKEGDNTSCLSIGRTKQDQVEETNKDQLFFFFEINDLAVMMTPLKLFVFLVSITVYCCKSYNYVQIQD